jgi:starch synthase
MHLLNVGWEYFTPDYIEFFGKINFLKAGIVFSDVLSTVSKQYSREIQTPEFGHGLDGILRTRKSDLYGIVNGIDYEEWNPEIDKLLPAHYGAEDMSNKLLCKKALQATFALPVNQNIPLLATISRLADQKGFDLLYSSMEEMLAINGGLQYIVLGTGDRKYHDLFTDLAKKFPKSLAIKIAYDNGLAHLIEAGADMFLMPSRYEPCGLNQLYSLRYGTVPIVRAVGGLEDTITDFTDTPLKGNGFKFYDYSKTSLLDTIERALKVYRSKKDWARIMRQCMTSDFSWERSAKEYMNLYKKAVEKHESH